MTAPSQLAMPVVEVISATYVPHEALSSARRTHFTYSLRTTGRRYPSAAVGMTPLLPRAFRCVGRPR
jgi:hypothetical protein